MPIVLALRAWSSRPACFLATAESASQVPAAKLQAPPVVLPLASTSTSSAALRLEDERMTNTVPSTAPTAPTPKLTYEPMRIPLLPLLPASLGVTAPGAVDTAPPAAAPGAGAAPGGGTELSTSILSVTAPMPASLSDAVTGA